MLFSAVLMNIPNSKVCLKGEWSIEIAVSVRYWQFIINNIPVLFPVFSPDQLIIFPYTDKDGHSCQSLPSNNKNVMLDDAI